MKNFKNTLFGLLGFGCFLLLVGCSTHKKHDNELIIGTCAGFPPYEVFNKEGDVIGFDIDIANMIAKKLGKKLVIKDMAFDGLLIALNQGAIDMVIAGVSITQAKCSKFAMVHYYGAGLKSLPVLFWQKIPAGVTEFADLAKQPNKTVCVQSGTLQDDVVSKYRYVDVRHLENIPDLILDIKHGKSRAAVIEPMVVTSLQQQFPEIKTLDLPLKEDEQDMGNGIVINKNNKELIKNVENIVQQLKKDGAIEKVAKKWFKEVSHDDQ